MALPFLPEHEIVPMFLCLKNQATTPPLQLLINYISDTWIHGSNWPPSSWTVYMQSVRTNNDVEGWHHSLNCRASGKSQLPMYTLINLLHQEAKLVSIQVRLVSEKKLKRIQRRKYRVLQARVFNLWGKYENNVKSAEELLRACSYLNGPINC